MKLNLLLLTTIPALAISCSEKENSKDLNVHVSGMANDGNDNLGTRIAQASLTQLQPHSIRVGDEYLLAKPSGSMNNGYISFDYTYYRMIEGKLVEVEFREENE